MNKNIKSQWITALESGEYKQGKDMLLDTTSHGALYCCLGVLTDLAMKSGVEGIEVVDGIFEATEMDSDEVQADGNTVLPWVVMAWAGMNAANPVIGGTPAATRNDGDADISPQSFAEIAQAIREDEEL